MDHKMDFAFFIRRMTVICLSDRQPPELFASNADQLKDAFRGKLAELFVFHVSEFS
jgi:hypothetical protein